MSQLPRDDAEPVGDIVRECLDEMAPAERERVAEFLDALAAAEATPGVLDLPSIEGYRLERVLGRGGFSTVFLARDERLTRRVAIKVIDPDVARGEDRFAEARQLASVEHENIVRVHTVGESGGRHYLDMEWIDGQTVEELIAACGRLPLRQALAIARDLARALATLHANGLVHRDLKPSNVMITREGTTKLMDLGIARRVDEPSSRGSGRAEGTPAYMAPEQYRCAETDPRSDLFSLGALLYEMVSGHRPFPANDPEEVRRQILCERPVPLLEHGDVAPSVADLIDKLLSKDPSARFVSAAELDRAIAGLAKPVVRRRSSKLVFAIGLAIGLGVGAWLLFSGALGLRTNQESLATALPEIGLRVLTGDGRSLPVRTGEHLHSGDQLQLHWSADRPFHVYVWTRTETGETFALFPDSRSRLTNPLRAGEPVSLPGPLTISEGAGTWDLAPPGGPAPQTLFVEAGREAIPELTEAFEQMSRPDVSSEVWERSTETLGRRAAAGASRGATRIGIAPGASPSVPEPIATFGGYFWSIDFYQLD